MQTDPVGYEDQMNLYACVGNDPLNLIDPSGRESWAITGTYNVGPALNTACGGNADCVAQSGVEALKAASGYNDAVDAVNSIKNGDITAAVVSAASVACKGCKAASKIEKNIKRFTKKIPANAKDNIERRELPNNGTAVQATSPGKVPGSKAVYEKQIDANGDTVQMTKTTYDPEGNIVHVKDKITNEEFRN